MIERGSWQGVALLGDNGICDGDRPHSQCDCDAGGFGEHRCLHDGIFPLYTCVAVEQLIGPRGIVVGGISDGVSNLTFPYCWECRAGLSVRRAGSRPQRPLFISIAQSWSTFKLFVERVAAIFIAASALPSGTGFHPPDGVSGGAMNAACAVHFAQLSFLPPPACLTVAPL
jgi:hypothetical protein